MEEPQKTFWSNFVAGLAGPGGATRKRRPLRGQALQRAEEDAADAFDTLTNLRDTDFWFDEDYKPLNKQLENFYKMGLVSTPPQLLRDGVNIGKGAILTPAGLDFVKAGRDAVDSRLAGNT